MILGSGVYAVAAVLADGSSITVLVVAIGAIIGLTIQFLGRGVSTAFVVLGALLGLLSFVVAKLFTIALYTVRVDQLSMSQLLSIDQLAPMWGWIFSGIRLVDLIFWLGAVLAAALLSKRRLSVEEDWAYFNYKKGYLNARSTKLRTEEPGST